MRNLLREKLFLPPAYVVRREGNTLILLVCPQGGYPYPIMLCNISQNAMGQLGGGGTLPGPTGRGTLARGYPGWGVPWPGGYPGWGGTLAGGYPGWGVPWSGTPPARSGWEGVPCLGGGYPGRTTEGVLTKRRAVCLLRSRRRTFLFKSCDQLW